MNIGELEIQNWGSNDCLGRSCHWYWSCFQFVDSVSFEESLARFIGQLKQVAEETYSPEDRD